MGAYWSTALALPVSMKTIMPVVAVIRERLRPPPALASVDEEQERQAEQARGTRWLARR